MSYPCKGRGRGLLRLVESKPGQQDDPVPTSPASVTPIQQLSALINALSIRPADYEVACVLHTIKLAVVDAESLKSSVQMFFARCEDDWKLAKCLIHCAASCWRLDELNFEKVSFRSEFLTTLRTIYNQKDSLRTEQPRNKWLACVAMLCQLAHQIPNPTDGKVMKILVDPVFDVLELCLSSESPDSDVICAATQIADIGQTLSIHCAGQRLKSLLNVLRDRVTKGSGSRESRLMFIDILESFASNWETSAASSEPNLHISPNSASR